MSEHQLRQTGIDILGALPWSSHICLFYETAQDLIDILARYFTVALKDGEACIWAASPPVGRRRAIRELRRALPDFDGYASQGQIEIVPGHEWYLRDTGFDARRVIRNWHAKLDAALSKGFTGLRVSGNAFWFEQEHARMFRTYERMLDRAVEGRPMLLLCSYRLRSAKAVDVLDAARAHHFTIARRAGEWEFLETPAFALSKKKVVKQEAPFDILGRPNAMLRRLTPRERVVLRQIVNGTSTKETARRLEVSPRTVEFHRANILRKLRVRNVAGLVGKVLGASGE